MACRLTILCSILVLRSSVPANAQTPEFLRKVSLREVEVDLQAALGDIFRGSTNKRLQKIEVTTWQTFQALPKNEVGRLAPPAVRYIVHNYFAKEHGWLITGLEPHGMQLSFSEVHDASILQERAPLVVEGLLEARQANHGLAFTDVVAMIAVLEQLMFDETVTLLLAAYRLNGLATDKEINEEMLHKVLRSYLILFGQGAKANLYDVEHHQRIVESRKRPEIEEFETDTVLNFEYARRHQANPFVPRKYSFQDAAEVLEVLAQQYGKWQNSECRDMKAHLAELDPEGLGRVPLGLFYAQPKGSAYYFSESVEYLRKTGALDETSIRNPKVIITNYVAGPSNCIASSAYYSVCCLSECDSLFGELEKHIAAPAASPQRLIALVGNMSDRALPQGLSDKLSTIATQHGGQVPLHGRLFAQWLHYAFPRECPFPSMVENSTALTASQWLEGDNVASAEERKHHVETSSASAVPSVEDFDIDARWSNHEVLPVLGETTSPLVHLSAGNLRILMYLAMIGVVVRSALSAWRLISPVTDSNKKDDDILFSIRV